MLKHYYPECEKNFGVIEEIINCAATDEPDEFLICTNIGKLHESSCLNFKPEIGMKVELFIDDDADGWFLKQVI